MELVLAASRDVSGCMVHFSSEVAGRTLTSAPVSTRNCRLEIESYTNRRLPVVLQLDTAVTDETALSLPVHVHGCRH